jgi:anthranilate synthase/aminodeoxychorismate synthase-like glutamine amidotransferase
VRVVFVENHDSFSWNVVDLLPFSRADVTIVHAPQALTALAEADALVVGPGPMDPVRAGLVELIRAAAAQRVPTLGVCLGHQAIGLAFGATLERSTPAHGKRAIAHFQPSRTLPGVVGDFEVMRYHSLSLREVRAPLSVVATLDDGTVMGLEHQSLPMLGLQFHPDSFGTPAGRAMVEAFFARATPVAHTRPPAPRAARAPRSPRSLQPKELDGAFALVAPGYGPDEHWTLVSELREGGRDVVLCEAEQRTPTWFGGHLEAVTPVLDPAPASLAPRLDDQTFERDVETIRETIAAGDVYQVNLTLRASLGRTSGAELLASLCRRGVPRFAAWVRLPNGDEFVTASPELLVEVDGQRVHAEPMKGTAPAGGRAWLEASEKDEAELSMITDLVRDDLQRVCRPRSVEVPSARRFIELPYAVQAVSDVVGALGEGLGIDDVLQVVHPGGSVTGAPRPAALAVIGQLEPTPRRFYCGTLGLSTSTETRCALLIRTGWKTGDSWRWGVGNGITWDSEASAEHEEVRVKLGAIG